MGFLERAFCGEPYGPRTLAGQLGLGEDRVVVTRVASCRLVAVVQDLVRAHLEAPSVVPDQDPVYVLEFETSPEYLLHLLDESYDKGKPCFTVVAAEGASPSAEKFRDFVNEAGGAYQADLTVLGHIQSGGSPSAFDRILAARLSAAAVEALAEREAGKMVGLNGDRVERVPLDEVVDEQRPLDPELYRLAGASPPCRSKKARALRVR